MYISICIYLFKYGMLVMNTYAQYYTQPISLVIGQPYCFDENVKGNDAIKKKKIKKKYDNVTVRNTYYELTMLSKIQHKKS